MAIVMVVPTNIIGPIVEKLVRLWGGRSGVGVVDAKFGCPIPNVGGVAIGGEANPNIGGIGV